MISQAVLYFGSYDPNYSRNRIIKKGLEANGLKVLNASAHGIIFFRYLKLTQLFLKNRSRFKTIIVGFPGHYDVPLAVILAKLFKKRVLYDIFASLYETYAIDRQRVKKNSIRAKTFFAVDWLGLKIADQIIVDTQAHGNFYKKQYSLKKIKTTTVYLGSDTDYFNPKNHRTSTDVFFYGSYQPLQGTRTIVEAASLLPMYNFKIIGKGQDEKATRDLAKSLKLTNVMFVKWLPLKNLAIEINKAKICLGVFGKSEKAGVVIPNKVFDAIACKKLVITEKSEGINEVFVNKRSIILVKKANAIELARAISAMLEKNTLREEIAKNSYEIFLNRFKPEFLVVPLLKYCR